MQESREQEERQPDPHPGLRAGAVRGEATRESAGEEVEVAEDEDNVDYGDESRADDEDIEEVEVAEDEDDSSPRSSGDDEVVSLDDD